MGGGHRRDAQAARGASARRGAARRCSTAGPISRKLKAAGKGAVSGGLARSRTRAGTRSARARAGAGAPPGRARTDEDQAVLHSRAARAQRCGRCSRTFPRSPAACPARNLPRTRATAAMRAGSRMKLGPFNASFEGEAHVSRIPRAIPATSRARASTSAAAAAPSSSLDYRLSALAPGETQVDIDADVQLVRAGRAVRPHRHRHRNRQHADPAVRAERRGEARGDAGGAGAGGRGDRAGSGGAAIAALRSQGRALPARPPPAPISAIGLVRKLIAAFVRRLFAERALSIGATHAQAPRYRLPFDIVSRMAIKFLVPTRNELHGAPMEHRMGT